jgi:hypothetical protein
VLIWSFIGIAVKQASTANVATTAWLAAGLILISMMYNLTRRQTV